MILSFLANDPSPDLPKVPRNGLHRLVTRYADEIRIILKLRTCTFTYNPQATSVNDFSPDLPNFPQNGPLGQGTHYEYEITTVLKL